MAQQLDLFLSTISEDTIQKVHDKKYSDKRLSPKDWEVYRLIYHNSITEHRKTTQQEICEKIDGFNWNNDPFCHDHCPSVWTSIKNNNESYEHEKIIISDNFEYWIGNEIETKAYLDKLWSDLQPRLKRYWNYLSKIRKHGQGKLLSCQNEEITDESKAREFVESWVEND